MDFLLAFVLSFGPAFACAVLVYWLDRYEKEATILLGAVFTWGAMVAVAAAVAAQAALSGASAGSSGAEPGSEVASASLIAPLVEESLKGIALLLVFLVLRRQFASYKDGLVFAIVCAFGFSSAVSFFYLIGAASEGGIAGLLDLFWQRTLVQLWDAPFYTAFLGLAFAVGAVTGSRLLGWLAAPAGWTAAVGFHALRNVLGSLADREPGLRPALFAASWGLWVGAAAIVWFSIARERKVMTRQLAEEVEAGRLTDAQARAAASAKTRLIVRFQSFLQGRTALTGRFFRVCGELAHRKERLERRSDSEGEMAAIEALRAELAELSPQVEGGEPTLAPPAGSG